MRTIALIFGILFALNFCSPPKPSYSYAFKKNLNLSLKKNGFQGGFTLIKYGNSVLESRKNFRRKILAGNLKHFFLSVGILRLADKDLINIESPIQEYLPDFPYKQLNVKSLMNHTSCLGSNLEKGEYWIWSPQNIVWLQILIEKISGKSLEKFYYQEFFSILKMKNSFFTKQKELFLTLEDLVRWDSAWDEDRILPKSLSQLVIEKTVLQDKYAENSFNYGLGVYADGRNFWQSSSQKNFSLFYYKIPEEKLSILIVAKNYQTKGDLLNWKSIITESIYNNRSITFKKKFNANKFISVQDAMKLYKVPAVGIALVRDFKIVWSQNFGVKEMNSTNMVDSNTLFRAGSLTKPITSYTYLRYAEGKHLTGNENLNAYAHSAKIDLSYWNSKERLTANHILSHTSGITERENWSTTANQNIRKLGKLNAGKGAQLSAYYSPGKKSRYSGGGYSVLQEYLTVSSGKRFPQLVREFVFDPFHMTQTTFEQDPSIEKSNRALGHFTDNQLVPLRFYAYPELAAGGMWTTPKDLATFFIALQKSLAGHSDSIASKSIARTMIVPIVPAANLSIHSWIGKGLFLNGTGKDWYFYHGGHSEGHKSIAMFHKSKGYGVVIMTNSENGSPLIWSILRSLTLSQSWDKFTN
jgi:CubicO group peptidase (beta-lactamase class C family)